MLVPKKYYYYNFSFKCKLFKHLFKLTLFNQVLQNFVQNAIKFTPNEKSIL